MSRPGSTLTIEDCYTCFDRHAHLLATCDNHHDWTIQAYVYAIYMRYKHVIHMGMAWHHHHASSSSCIVMEVTWTLHPHRAIISRKCKVSRETVKHFSSGTLEYPNLSISQSINLRQMCWMIENLCRIANIYAKYAVVVSIAIATSVSKS